MLQLRKLRDLDLVAPPQAGRPAHLSAASGLARAGKFLYVVADDEHALAVFPATGAAPGQLIPLVPGQLPLPKTERKAQKPDFEILLRLPEFSGHPQGALLALGSGSTVRRERGVLLPLESNGRVGQSPRAIDAAPLFRRLRALLGEVNLEGAVAVGGRLLLLQRGNRGAGRNASVSCNLPAVLDALAGSDVFDTEVLDIRDHDLGHVDGVPLCFSDGAALPGGRWVFSAIAEDTADSYADGRCAGAALGLISPDGQLAWLRPLPAPHKIEGIEVLGDDGALELLLVTDADAAEIPASLFSVRVEA